MKRAQSRFSVKPKLQGGGMLDFLNQKGAGGVGTMAGGIGAGLDLVTGLIGNKQPKPMEATNTYSTDAASNYNDILAKNQATKSKVSGGLSAAGSAAMMINPIVGLGLKGLGAVAKMIPFGQGKARDAAKSFAKMDQAGNQLNMANQGAINRNSAFTDYKAPAYGKKGMKFKTKFSKL